MPYRIVFDTSLDTRNSSIFHAIYLDEIAKVVYFVFKNGTVSARDYTPEQMNEILSKEDLSWGHEWHATFKDDYAYDLSNFSGEFVQREVATQESVNFSPNRDEEIPAPQIEDDPLGHAHLTWQSPAGDDVMVVDPITSPYTVNDSTKTPWVAQSPIDNDAIPATAVADVKTHETTAKTWSFINLAVEVEGNGDTAYILMRDFADFLREKNVVPSGIVILTRKTVESL